MNLINIENVSKTYSEKVLINNVSFNINDDDRIGIIGVNGAGKSTLLKVISGKDEFFDGKITMGKNIRIEYLDQNPKVNKEFTIVEQIFDSESYEMKLLMEYEELLNKSTISNEIDNNKLIKLQEKIDDLNLWALESEIKTILTKLGITDINAKMSTLSGGQIKRVFLAATLIKKCDLLVLD